MPKLTKRFVGSLRPKIKGDLWAWDDEIPRFGIRVKPSGRKSYLIQYRAAGKTRRYTIGGHGALTPAEARKEARSLLAQVDKGGDPAGERKEGLRAPKIKDLAARYLSEHAKPKKKAFSYKRDKQLMERFILPEFGGRKVESLKRADAVRLHNRVGKGAPIQANRMLALLSKMMTLAIAWGLYEGLNPCKHVERFKERKRERFLSADELVRLGAELSKAEAGGKMSPYAVAAKRFLMLTGMRVGEVLGHPEPSATARYSHLGNDPLKAAADLVAERIREGMSKPAKEKVAELANRKK